MGRVVVRGVLFGPVRQGAAWRVSAPAGTEAAAMSPREIGVGANLRAQRTDDELITSALLEHARKTRQLASSRRYAGEHLAAARALLRAEARRMVTIAVEQLWRTS